MSDRTDLIYRYDGSLPGLLTCVFESIAKKESPIAILSPDDEEYYLLPEKEIITDEVKARRVAVSIPKKISPAAWDLVWRGYLTCHPDRARLIVDFLRLGYKVGGKVVDMLGDETVSALSKAVLHMNREAHLLTGFTRFSITGDVMTAVIAPKNNVLPLLAPHFRTRYPSDSFMIFDRTHGLAYFHTRREDSFRFVEELQLPPASPEEMRFRQMWKRYYDTIAIEGRYNPRCRMTHMPKRYWDCLTELNPEFTEPTAERSLTNGRF